jgi:hypothetical protein
VAPQSSTYTYLAYDLLSGQRIAELPLSDVTYTLQLPEFGDGGLSGAITPSAAMGRTGSGRQDLAQVLGYRTEIFVDRDGRCMGGFFFRYWDQAPGGVALGEGGCPGWFAYFAEREIRTTLTYHQVDQFAIANNVIAAMQAKPGGNARVTLQTGKTSGVLRDRTYPASESKKARDAVVELSAVIGGFDLRTATDYGPGRVPVKTMLLDYPRTNLYPPDNWLGVPVFTYPGNIRGYTSFGDSSLATDIVGVGGGDGLDAIRAYAVNQHLKDAGWPVIERSLSWTDVTNLATLQGHVDGEALQRAQLSFTIVVDVGPDDPQLGTYWPGDWCRLRLSDDVFFGVGAPGADVDVDARITQISVKVPDSGPEQVSVTISGRLLL